MSVSMSLASTALDLRHDFPILARRIEGRPIVYLDSASTSQNGQSVSTDQPKATTYGIAFTLGGWVGL